MPGFVAPGVQPDMLLALHSERDTLWFLGVQRGFRQAPAADKLTHPANCMQRVHEGAFQNLLDMPTFPNSYRKQVQGIGHTRIAM